MIPEMLFLTNITYPEFEDSIIEVSPNDVVIVGAPVYAGMIAPTALQRLKTIKFQSNPAILVAVYGNRHFDDALVDLREFAVSVGLKPFAAAAFVGQHSFSSGRDKIAHGRPDELDICKAGEFGNMALNKLQSLNGAENIGPLTVPGNFPLPLPESRLSRHAFADTVKERCIKCGVCQSVCPTGAVYFKKSFYTNKELCTLCMACVNACKQNARAVDPAFLRKVREHLLESASVRREPEFFL